LEAALPAGYRIEEVDDSADAVLRNLFEHYLHDMAEWFLFDSREDGAYHFATEEVWGTYRVYLLYAARIPVGFALVGSADEYLARGGVHDMDEFFVVRRHRRHGLVRVYEANLPAVPFWRAAISSYTRDAFVEQARSVRDRPWSYFEFRADA